MSVLFNGTIHNITKCENNYLREVKLMSGLKQSTKIIAGLLLILKVTAPLSAQNDASDQLLKMVPSDSLFCVIINNFDYSMNQTDQFLAGVSPMYEPIFIRR